MQFKPSVPREDVNVSLEHPLREAAILLMTISAALAALVTLFAWSIDLAVAYVSPAAEAKIFQSLGREIARLGSSDDHQEQRSAAQTVVDRLARHWPDAPYSFQVEILAAEEANAAALPGGYILVTTALLEAVESEQELAFVLGHELGHFRNRDHLRRLGRGFLYGLVVATAFGFAGTLPDVSTLAGELAASSFDREHEREADRFGLRLVYEEYGKIGTSWRFFERLADEETSLDKMTTYLSTHPASSQRVADLAEFARQQGWTASPGRH